MFDLLQEKLLPQRLECRTNYSRHDGPRRRLPFLRCQGIWYLIYFQLNHLKFIRRFYRLPHPWIPLPWQPNHHVHYPSKQFKSPTPSGDPNVPHSREDRRYDIKNAAEDYNNPLPKITHPKYRRLKTSFRKDGIYQRFQSWTK